MSYYTREEYQYCNWVCDERQGVPTKEKLKYVMGIKKFPNTKAPLSEWSGSRNNLICVEVSE